MFGILVFIGLITYGLHNPELPKLEVKEVTKYSLNKDNDNYVLEVSNLIQEVKTAVSEGKTAQVKVHIED